MYLFINPYAFQKPKGDITESEILIALDNLAHLFIELKKINVELIIHQSLGQTSLCGKSIREYIAKLEISAKQAIINLVGKIRPMCSDTDTTFEQKESIAFGNCLEEVEKIDICYTFLSCALYYKNPILTINNLCSKSQFLNDKIKIVCDREIHLLENYKLIPYCDVIKKINTYMETHLFNKYYSINNWDDYMDFINSYFCYSKITEHCIFELKKKYSYTNSYACDFRKKVERIENFVKDNGGKPRAIDFNRLSQKHYCAESSSRKIELAKSHRGILNFSGEEINLDWHTWIQKDCRVYFEKEDDHICFVHYEKKIN